MNEIFTLTTSRLGLRRWSDADHEPFARMNADPLVMRYFPSLRSREETEAFVGRIEEHFERRGFGLYAVEELESGAFIGFIGFQTATFEADFTPCVEIGWRLDSAFWHRGYATEGALACLHLGFGTLGIEEIFSFTSTLNLPSIAVMRRIGLRYLRDFGHPRIDPSHELHRHVLYGLKRSEYGQKGES